MGPIIGHSDGRYGGTTHGMRAQSTAALVAMANLKGRHPAAGPQHQPTELPELTGAAPASPPALRCPPAGNVTFAVVDMQTNEKFETVMAPGDMGVMPQGYVHYLANTGCEPAHVLGVFTASNYTRVSLAPTVTALGPAVTDEMFGASADLEAKPAALIAPLSSPDCKAACNA